MQQKGKGFLPGDFEILGQRLTWFLTSKYRKTWRLKEYSKTSEGYYQRKTRLWRHVKLPSVLHLSLLLVSQAVLLRREKAKSVWESLKYNQILLAGSTKGGKAVSLIKIWTSASTPVFHNVTRYFKIWYSFIAGCSTRRAVSNGFTLPSVLAAACWTGKWTSISYLFLQSVYLPSP